MDYSVLQHITAYSIVLEYIIVRLITLQRVIIFYSLFQYNTI